MGFKLLGSGASVTSAAVVAALAGQDVSLNSLTFTNADGTSVLLGMDFGFGYLTVIPDPAASGGAGGLDVFGAIFAGGDGVTVNSADPSAVPPVVGGTFGWASGQNFYEDASIPSLGSQYIATISNFQIGYTGSASSATPARHFYVEAGTGDVRLAGNLGVGNSASASVIPVSGLVKKIEIFDAAGTSLGFIPVYSSIA